MSIDNPITNYEAELEKLEQIVSAMESGELPLESALEHYERGIHLIRQCQEALNRAEQKIHILTRDQHSEVAQLTPFDEA